MVNVVHRFVYFYFCIVAFALCFDRHVALCCPSFLLMKFMFPHVCTQKCLLGFDGSVLNNVSLAQSKAFNELLVLY